MTKIMDLFMSWNLFREGPRSIIIKTFLNNYVMQVSPYILENAPLDKQPASFTK